MPTLFDEVYHGYIVASLPFDTKEQAYEEIRTYRQNVDCTTYFCQEDGKWYVLERKTWK